MVQEERSFLREVSAIAAGLSALFLAVSLASSLGASEFLLGTGVKRTVGPFGSVLAQTALMKWGLCSFGLCLILFGAAKLIWTTPGMGAVAILFSLVLRLLPVVALLLSVASLSFLTLGFIGGGLYGERFTNYLVGIFGQLGACLTMLVVAVVSLRLLGLFDLGQLARAAAFASELLGSGLRTAGAGTNELMRKSASASVSGASWSLAAGAEALRSSGHTMRELLVDFWQHMSLVGEESLSIPVAEDSAKAARREKTTKGAESKRGKIATFVLGSPEDEQSAQEDEAREGAQNEDSDSEEDLPVYTRKDRLADGEEEEVEDAADTASRFKISRRDESWSEIKKSIESQEPEAGPDSLLERYESYRSPDIGLLVAGGDSSLSGPDDDSLIENSRRLEEALANFKIGGKVVEVHPGPVITMYQFLPAAGVKVQRVINLADDLALGLKVASVRVFAPVPGKGTIGVEVPNPQREIVRLHDVLNCEAFETEESDLPLALGKDTYGSPFIACLPRMPHLLIAGATGTGKSVCINSLLLSLLYKNTPSQLQLILVDPKMLELSVYEDIPHLKSPVVTNVNKAKGVLHWAVEEMERRYRLLKDTGVRDLASYNRLARQSRASQAETNGEKRKNVTIELEERDVVATGVEEGLDRKHEDLGDREAESAETFEELPRIVVVVDELADLMLSVGREVEELLTRLAQKARAAGIHLILATQRPSVNVITGLIKANFPARISFKVTSKIDSRTVLDCSGAERLLGQGDMLYSSPAVGGLKRLHSPYVSDQEVNDVADWLRRQGEPQYDEDIEKTVQKITQPGDSPDIDGNGNEYDEFYDSAVSLVIDKGQASTSMVQRAFRIGYNRAARILEVMEDEGVVGPADGSRPRKVLVAGMSSDDEMI